MISQKFIYDFLDELEQGFGAHDIPRHLYDISVRKMDISVLKKSFCLITDGNVRRDERCNFNALRETTR